MQKKSKAAIKKLIAELHAKPINGEEPKTHAAEQGSVKASKGAQTNKTYRPKI